MNKHLDEATRERAEIDEFSAAEAAKADRRFAAACRRLGYQAK